MDTTDRHQDHAAGIVPRPERVNRLADFLAGSPDPTGWVVRRLRVAVEYPDSSQGVHLLVVELLAALDRVSSEQVEQVAADEGCDCPVQPCPEMRGDPADTLVDHQSGCHLQPDEDIRNALADDLVRMGLMPEAGAR